MYEDAELHAPQLKALLREGANEPDELWSRIARELEWFEPWTTTYEEGGVGEFAWFEGGATNVCYNCLDRHVERGATNRAALIYETGERDVTRTLTYGQLLSEVKRVAATLREFGVERGDAVAIYMPTCPEAVVAMLACARVGAVHVAIFSGFGTGALAERLELAGANLLLTADVGFRKGETVGVKATVDRCLAERDGLAEQVDDVLVLRRGDDELALDSDRDARWADALSEDGDVGPVEMSADEPLFVLPTSGTTGEPKGVVQTHGGYQVHVYAMGGWTYGLDPTDVWFATADVGWVVGHSCSVYGPLLRGATSVLYEGTPEYPDPGAWWRVVERNGVTGMFLTPTAIRTLSGADDAFHERYDLRSLERVVSGGEPLNPSAWRWLQRTVLDDAVPVLDHMWQTENGGPIIGNPYGIAQLPIKPGSAGIALPGIDATVVNEDGEEVAAGTEGVLVVERPFPGLTPTLWEGHDRYRDEYWRECEGAYWVGDAVVRDEDGYFHFRGRADEIITTAGHRIGPADVEHALTEDEAVVEAAAVGKPHPEKTEVISAFVVLVDGFEPTDRLRDRLVERVREVVGPIAVVDDVRFVERLPKNRAGKILRRTIRAALVGDPVGDASVLTDPSALDCIERACEGIEVERE